jgi:putative methanogenesis marker protein 12
MFIGIDHGTRAIRFATTEGGCYELPRKEAGKFSPEEIIQLMKKSLDVKSADLVALTYSMGDALTRIVRIEDAPNRGLISQDGAGLHVGGGTRVFDAIRGSGWPAIMLPGIHCESDIDPRLKIFSHGASPEKVGLAYYVCRRGAANFIISDASSNTVTLGAVNGRIVGAIDAPIFAPGLLHGPLDVKAIRDVDSGKITANEAFTRGGILSKGGSESLDQCGSDVRKLALESLALFSAMEICAMSVLLRALGATNPELYLAGSPAPELAHRVSELLGRVVQPLDNFCPAKGCAQIAEDVYFGKKSILGLDVDEQAQRWG